MRTADGFYWIPLLPKEFAEKMKGLPRVEWEPDAEKEYRRLHAEFTASKAEFLSWVRKDRDSRMNATAKVILSYLVDCLNFDTGRCDPAHQTIADEIEVSIRTVERLIPRIAAASWIAVTRRGKTTTNFYRLRAPVEKIADLLNRVDDLRQQRADRREERRRRQSDPTEMADHKTCDPTSVRSHDPTEMAAHDPTEMADKPMNRTSECEPLNKGIIFERKAPPRHPVPTPEPRRSAGACFTPPASEDEGRDLLIREGLWPKQVDEMLPDLMAGTLHRDRINETLKRKKWA